MLTRLTTLTVLAGVLAASGCAPTRGDARASRGALAARTALADAADRFYTANGVTIRYRVIGAGEPLVLLHGYTDAVEMWAGPADSLARDFRVIVPDLRGFGKSTKFGDAEQYGLKMADDVIGLLDELHVRSAHVMGYSMGAVLAANLALDHPTRVRSATFVAGAFWPDSVEAARVLAPFVTALERGQGLGPFFRWILPTWSDSARGTIVPPLEAANDSASLVASLRALPKLMIDTARAARSHVPTAAVVSVKDPVLPLSRLNARHWPGIRHVEIPTHDHADIFLAPQVVAEFRRLTGR